MFTVEVIDFDQELNLDDSDGLGDNYLVFTCQETIRLVQCLYYKKLWHYGFFPFSFWLEAYLVCVTSQWPIGYDIVKTNLDTNVVYAINSCYMVDDHFSWDSTIYLCWITKHRLWGAMPPLTDLRWGGRCVLFLCRQQHSWRLLHIWCQPWNLIL